MRATTFLLLLVFSGPLICLGDFNISRTTTDDGVMVSIRTDTDSDLQKCELDFVLIDGEIELVIAETRANGSINLADRTFDADEILRIRVRCGGCPHVVAGYGSEAPIDVDGGRGDDRFSDLAYADGRAGDDRFTNVASAVGGSGNDVIHGCTWADGERGDDIIVCREDATGARVFGGAGDDIIIGTRGNDALYGDLTFDNFDVPGRDIVFGLGGNDRLVGGGDFDYLNGGSGDDLLDPGDFTFGNFGPKTEVPTADEIEVLFGGTGSDEFIAYHVNGDVIPVFHDVSVQEGDFLTRIYINTLWRYVAPQFIQGESVSTSFR